MIKADSASLQNLSHTIRNELDKFLLKINELYALQSRLEQSWDAEKCGSFTSAMNTVKNAVFNVEEGCLDAIKEIGEMIEIVRKYESIHF